MVSTTPEPIAAVLFDLSGVLISPTGSLEGAVQTVAACRRAGLVLRFVTNTASRSKAMLLQDLAQRGFKVHPEELFTAPQAARAYIQQHQLRPFCILHPNLKAEFADVHQSQPNAVLLGDAHEGLSYAAMNQAFALMEAGAPLIGIGKNKYYKDTHGLNLDAGPFIHALEWATNTQALIMGKPNANFFAQVVDSTGFRAGQCLMIGDDVLGDVQGAMNAGLQGALVQTGKYKPKDLQLLPEGAYLLPSVAQIFSLLT